jgi:hypothetical protein
VAVLDGVVFPGGLHELSVQGHIPLVAAAICQRPAHSRVMSFFQQYFFGWVHTHTVCVPRGIRAHRVKEMNGVAGAACHSTGSTAQLSIRLT